MRTFMKTISFLIVLSVASVGHAETLTVEGVVSDVNFSRQTFSLCPDDDSCGITEENVFVVLDDTKMEKFSHLMQLSIGDRIVVKGEPINKVVWKALLVTKK